MKSALAAFLIALACASTGYAVDRALIVGVEKYRDPRVPDTPGCEADARAMEQLIKSVYKFAEVKVLINEEATASNIERWFRFWLIEGTRPGDRVFFFYAGHGSQIADDNGDEPDGKDETLAPYDVDPRSGANMIRDDLFDEMIGKLSGRRAVLVFDSCHSGTISRGVPKLKDFARGGGVRYLPTPEQFAELEAAASRDAGGAGYVVKRDARRDLVVEDDFIEPRRFSAVSGAVIISAAGDRQLVYPLAVEGGYRGALSYLLVESLKRNQPRLRDLAENIRRQIRQLQIAGRLEGDQQPVFTITDNALLADKPLFATWEETPIIALSNRLSPIKIQLRDGDNKSAYRIGEKITYEVTTDAPGYLYLIVFSRQNVATCIFPSSQDPNNLVAPGAIRIPRSAAYEFPIQEPAGRDVVVALLSKQKLDLGEKVEYTWNEVFERLNLKLLQDEVGKYARRDLNVEKTETGLGAGDWQATFLILETLALVQK
ncbi:MAG TPA: caspase family protein [Blastocatellia bacterium]|nr:caspase family protein [Blastocatellia bacterium]